MISPNMVLSDDIKHMLTLKFNTCSEIYNYMINNNITINHNDFIKLCMIKCEKNTFDYLVNFFINKSIDNYDVDIRYMYLLNNIINKHSSKRFITDKDYDIESYTIDDDINYMLLSKSFIININYIIKDTIYLFNIESFMNLFNRDVIYSNFDVKKLIIDYYYKYNMYRSYIANMRYLNIKLYILNNEGHANDKKKELSDLNDKLKRKYKELDNLNNKIDKKDEYFIQLSKTIENDEKIHKKRQREYEDRRYEERGYTKYQKIDEKSRYLTYEPRYKKYVDNRKEFAIALLNGEKICSSWESCDFNNCNKIHIKFDAVCPNIMQGFICLGEKHKQCNYIHIDRCWSNENCRYPYCSRLHAKNMKTKEYKDNFNNMLTK